MGLLEKEPEKKRTSRVISILILAVMAVAAAQLLWHCVWFDWSR